MSISNSLRYNFLNLLLNSTDQSPFTDGPYYSFLHCDFRILVKRIDTKEAPFLSEKVSKRFGLFGQGLERTTMTEETTLVVDKKSDGSLRLVENPVTHKYTETCFSNFFLCTERNNSLK